MASAVAPKVTPSELAAFYVFNPTLGDEDTEGDKVMPHVV
jgi:hypothetical protein